MAWLIIGMAVSVVATAALLGHLGWFERGVGAVWRRVRPARPQADNVSVEQLAADLRRLAAELERCHVQDQPAKMARLTAAALAYDWVLLSAARTLDVPGAGARAAAAPRAAGDRGRAGRAGFGLVAGQAQFRGAMALVPGGPQRSRAAARGPHVQVHGRGRGGVPRGDPALRQPASGPRAADRAARRPADACTTRCAAGMRRVAAVVLGVLVAAALSAAGPADLVEPGAGDRRLAGRRAAVPAR